MKITSTTVVGKKHVYDLEVDGNHTFVANNVVVHNCLDEDTNISMRGGAAHKKIKGVSVGDVVKSYDVSKQEVVYRTVTAVYDQGLKLCTMFFIDDLMAEYGCSSITCTPDHHLMTDNGWVQAKDLPVVDDRRRDLFIGRGLQSTILVGMRNTYDLEVEDTHCFYAGGLLVHNCTGRGAQNLFMKAKPKSIIDIAALTSIYRPGPLVANIDKLWIKCEKEPYDWGHPLLNDALKETRGCVAGDTLVQVPEGRVTVREVVEGTVSCVSVLSVRTEDLTFEQDRIVAGMMTGVKLTLELTAADGSTLRLTNDHPVLTQRGWVPAGELTLEDSVATTGASGG